jgi:hypothetical protein
MDRYLIETLHTGSECLDLIKLINAQGYLWNFDWDAKLASTADGPSLRRKMKHRLGWQYRRWCAVRHESLS